MTFVTRSPIDIGALIGIVSDKGRGGTVAFLGSVRRSREDGPVVAIEYSAYEEMLETEFGKIVAEARLRWPGAGIAAQHRLGEVPAGAPSLAAVVAAAHRDEAFEAARYVVEEAKRRLPVWKRERFEDGTARWREE
ncbi:MAG: molybdenum cofactor biosynthesis protein MoaE [Gemmatimonadales bacterium]|nr:molybdenum cofactor biosynthesis protein MoaE [Gemmatimonadales bacterium]